MQALDTVAKEIPEPGKTEFGRVVAEIRLGRSVEDALNAMAERVGSYDFKWAVLAVRRFMLYDVFLHELGHLQVFDSRRASRRLRFFDEKLANEFAISWRRRLWSARPAGWQPVAATARARGPSGGPDAKPE